MEHTVNETLIYVISLAFGVRKGDVSAAILAVLIELGFQSHTDGFGYLRKAILIKTTDSDLRLAAVYQEIVRSSNFTLSTNQVEQAMVTAIESAWKHRDREKWDYFFSEQRMGKRGRPTNKEFVSQIACFMELWNSHCQEVCYGGN